MTFSSLSCKFFILTYFLFGRMFLQLTSLVQVKVETDDLSTSGVSVGTAVTKTRSLSVFSAMIKAE